MQRAIKLSDNDRELLRKIFEYGGYTTSLSILAYRDDISTVAVFYILKKLSEGGYLKEIPFYSDSRKNALVYQVTAKTCKLFDNPDSYYRKRHEDSYIIRALIKQHFLFEICREYGENIITENEKRIQLLTQEVGFDEELLPKKYNRGVAFTHVEEYVLDTRNILRRDLYCGSSGEMVCNFYENTGPVIIYVDKATANVLSQMTSLIEKYRPLLDSGRTPIGFLLVVDSKKREYSYSKAVERIMKQQPGTLDKLIGLHTDILRKRLGVEPGKVDELPDKIRAKYTSVEDITDDDYSGIPADELQVNYLRTAGQLADEILNRKCRKEEKLIGITELFRKLYRLAAAGKIQNAPELTIRIYRIGYKFSIS